MQLSMFAKSHMAWNGAFQGKGMFVFVWDIARDHNREKAKSGHIRDPYRIC